MTFLNFGNGICQEWELSSLPLLPAPLGQHSLEVFLVIALPGNLGKMDGFGEAELAWPHPHPGHIPTGISQPRMGYGMCDVSTEKWE